jgi:hypothetical protein
MLSIPYLKCWEPEVHQILEFLRFWNIYIDFTGWAPLIQKSETWNAIKIKKIEGDHFGFSD